MQALYFSIYMVKHTTTILLVSDTVEYRSASKWFNIKCWHPCKCILQTLFFIGKVILLWLDYIIIVNKWWFSQALKYILQGHLTKCQMTKLSSGRTCVWCPMTFSSVWLRNKSEWHKLISARYRILILKGICRPVLDYIKTTFPVHFLYITPFNSIQASTPGLGYHTFWFMNYVGQSYSSSCGRL
jgi:hypothetical protein